MTDTADRDAAPAAAEGADLIARIAATSCADVTLLMAHEWVHAAKKTYAASPAPAAAPRAGDDAGDLEDEHFQCAEWCRGGEPHCYEDQQPWPCAAAREVGRGEG